jgi:hypothetical protein
VRGLIAEASHHEGVLFEVLQALHLRKRVKGVAKVGLRDHEAIAIIKH